MFVCLFLSLSFLFFIYYINFLILPPPPGRRHVERYLASAEKEVERTELGKRVMAWQSRIEPILQASVSLRSNERYLAS